MRIYRVRSICRVDVLNHVIFKKKSTLRYLSDNIMLSKQKFKTNIRIYILHMWLDM